MGSASFFNTIDSVWSIMVAALLIHLKRVVEPELMVDSLQVKAYAEADFDRSDDALVNRLENYLCGFRQKIDSSTLFVDLGCGPGNITERLAKRWPSAKVLGIDASDPMLSIAKRRKDHETSLSHLKGLSYYSLDLSKINNEFADLGISADVLVSNSLLHHLHDPSCFWKVNSYFANPGSAVFHRDLRRPSSIDKALALQRKYLADSPAVLICDFLASLQAAFTVKEVQHQLKLAGLEYLKVEEVEDRYLEIKGTFR